MKKLRKIVSTILVLAMIVTSFAACSSNKEKDTGKDTGNNDGGQVTADGTKTDDSQAENPYEKKLTFTMSAIDAEKAGLTENGEVAANYKWLCDKFNVDFEFWPLTWSNYIDQTRMWINSDSAPDIMMLDVAPVRYSEYLEWVNAEMFRAYDLDKYSNLKSAYDGMITGKKFSVNDKLYAWPATMDTSTYNFTVAQGYIYRKDWAKSVGLYHDDNIYTWDEWTNLVSTVKAKDPGNNGAGNTLGIITAVNWAFPKYITGFMSPYMVSFAQDADGSWKWGPTLPETLEAVKTVKDLYDKGIIWADQPMVQDGDAKNNFAAGRLFAATAYNTTLGMMDDYRKTFEDANPEIKSEDAMDLAMIKGTDGKFLTWQSNDQWSQTAMSHNITDEKAQRWQDILDYLVSGDGYYFRNYGIQDVDWKYDGDQAVCLWKQNDDGSFINPYSYGTWPWARTAGNNDGFSMIDPSYPEWERNIYLNAMKIFSDESQTTIIPVNANFSFFTSDKYAQATAGLETEVVNKIAELMTSKDIETDWNAWVTQKSSEVTPALDELNANVK